MDKVTSTNKMTLIDKQEITVGDYITTKISSNFFSYIIINLNIAEIQRVTTYQWA